MNDYTQEERKIKELEERIEELESQKLVKRKPKVNYSAANMPEKDLCQTPSYALEPLLPYLLNLDTQQYALWECAAGEGLLSRELARKTRLDITSTDITLGCDFLQEDWRTLKHGKFDPQAKKQPVIVTNPPFSLKYKFIEHCYKLGHPWALLMPSDTLFAASANKLFQKYGIEIIIINPRIDFKMPNKGWSGNGAQMSTSWFTWGLIHGRGEIGLHFTDISAAKKRFKEMLNDGNRNTSL